jgi:hypothetical protein
MSSIPLTREQLARYFRARLNTQLHDDSGLPAEGIAIYSLSDPRDIRHIRYIGQTKHPRRRLLQHWNTARLWLPDEKPWWVQSPKLRPLYDWIRELYQDGHRLPVMVISSWEASLSEARLAERNRIYACLAEELPLLNVEREILAGQQPLL